MIQQAQDTMKRLWQQLSWGQRITLIALSAAVVGVIGLLAMWANTPNYQVLFSNLSSQDAGSITAQLDAQKIPYQLSDGGTTILVPQAQVYGQRIKLATQGLPQGGTVGFSLFDKSSMLQGSDTFQEQVTLTRALEGELTQTIGAIGGVAYDRVNIVVPQSNLFTSDQVSPSASVLIKMGLGSGLSSDQVAGVQHLVASAVQGLKPDAVTVVDGSGNILSANTGTDAGAAGMTALQAQARYASNLEAQLSAMLDTVVGPGKAVVRVNALLDWTARDATATQYAPQASISPLTQSHVDDHTVLGPSSSVGGVAGVGSNVPTYGAGGKGTGVYTDTQHIQDLSYAAPMTTTHVIAAPGAVQRLSVAVLVDGTLSAAQQAALNQTVSAAAGLVQGRDQLSIQAIPFDTAAATAAATALAAQQQRDLILSIARWAALIVVPLVLLFLLRKLLVPAKLQDYEMEDYPDAPGGYPVLDHGQPLLKEAEDILTAAQHSQRSLVRESLADVARKKPEVLAGMISRWMDEDR